MIVKRERDVDEINFTFRFLNVPFDIYNVVVRDLENNFNFSVHKKESYFNILINVEHINNSQEIKKIISDHNLTEIDIYIGIISSYDHGGVSVPKNVSRLIRDVDCDLNFSFVSGDG